MLFWPATRPAFNCEAEGKATLPSAVAVLLLSNVASEFTDKPDSAGSVRTRGQFDTKLFCTVKLGSMPVVFRYKSFRFFFYSNEANPREVMHIHVRGTAGEAKFWLTPTVYLADSDGFDARTLRELRDAVIDNKELIERAWHEHFA